MFLGNLLPRPLEEIIPKIEIVGGRLYERSAPLNEGPLVPSVFLDIAGGLAHEVRLSECFAHEDNQESGV